MSLPTVLARKGGLAIVILLLLGALLAGRHFGLFRDNLVVTAEQAGSFETLLGLLDAAGLRETLSGEAHYTLFAPTDAAFARLPAGWLEALREDPAALRELVGYHLAEGDYSDVRLSYVPVVPTLAGKAVVVKTRDAEVRLNSATALGESVLATNGFVHVIGDVLIPTDATPLNEPRTAAFVDLERLRGGWHKIACFIRAEDAAQKDRCPARSGEIRYDDGRIIFEKRCQLLGEDADGTGAAPVQAILSKTDRADVVDPLTQAKLRFERGMVDGKMTYSDIWILAVDGHYQWVILGNPNRGYAVILARDRQLDDARYGRLVEIVTRRGYDPERLVKLPVWQDVPASTPVREVRFN